MSGDPVLLRDILTSIENIEKYSSRGKEEFSANELIQTWIVHQLQIIGEAASRVSETFRANHREISWKQIIGLRQVLLHENLGVNLATVWHIVENELPSLKGRTEALLRTS